MDSVNPETLCEQNFAMSVNTKSVHDFIQEECVRRTRLFLSLLSDVTSLHPGSLLWHTLPTYVTSTYFPLSFWMTNRTLTLHSGRLHSAPPLKNTAEWILREFSDLT